MRPFTGNFTQQEPMSQAAVAAALDIMQSGRLHRYNVAPGETPQASMLEEEYARYQGVRYCLACASGGYAMGIALRAAGVKQGDPVLTNAFTLAPVPGAITGAGGCPVLVEITKDLALDLIDLREKIQESGARFMMLSNMRGHLADMDALCDLLDEHRVQLIEDCAHTMGSTWNGKRSGNFGLAGCFSTQTYKHMNSGEGGFLTSDDPEFMARAIIMSGSYMMYERHGASPDSSYFKDIRLQTPNLSGRMDNLRAAILRPQLATLDQNVTRWNERYRALETKLLETPDVYVPHRPSQEGIVGSSFQFLRPGITVPEVDLFVEQVLSLGVELKWFGSDEPIAFTSNHHSWQYLQASKLPKTDEVLSGLFDVRIPLTFSVEDCAQVGEIIDHCARLQPLEGAV